MSFKELLTEDTKEQIVTEKSDYVFENMPAYALYHKIQDDLSKFFGMWKELEQKIDRKTYNELRSRQFTAGQELAKLSDRLRTIYQDLENKEK